MNLELWHAPTGFSFEFLLAWSSIILSIIYAGLFLGVMWKQRSDFRQMGQRQWIGFGLALLASIPANFALVLQRTSAGSLPVAPISVLPAQPTVSLAGLTIVTAVAIWLGAGPAGVVNLLASLVWTWFFPLTFTDLLAFTSWGIVMGLCIHQPYKGKFFALLRMPLVAALVSSLAPVCFFSFSRLGINLPTGGLLAVDYVASFWNNELPLWALSGLGTGIVFQLIFLNSTWRPAQRNDVVSVYGRSLRARFLIFSIPLVLLSIVLSVLAVTSRAITLARDQAIAEMARSADNASERLRQFNYTGPNLLTTFAEDPALLDPERRVQALRTNRQVVPFFQELLIVNPELEVIAAVPAETHASLTTEEHIAAQKAMDVGISQITRISMLPSGEYGLTAMQPIFSAEEHETPVALLLGRVQLNVNPYMRQALDALQLTRDTENSFILDEWNVIIAHPNSDLILRPWDKAATAAPEPGEGVAYEEVSPDSQRILTYLHNSRGTPYMVVLQHPYAVVLETATAIASPLLMVQILVGGILLFAIPFYATRIIKPLNKLAEAANHIATENLDKPEDWDIPPVSISGDDEVAQLGSAFEQMQIRLQARLVDLSLLLEVAQAVSATLDLESGVMPILDGALEETGATVARFILLSPGGNRIQRVLTRGGEDVDIPNIAALDRDFSKALRRRRQRLVIQDLSETKGTARAAHPLRSVAVFPVRLHNDTVAIFWVGADHSDAFDEARVNFLSTLANQAAVLVENARLFQAAEGGRRRLAAILASTTDAILVIDSRAKLLLINPAAQRVLEVNESAYGRLLRNLDIPDPLKTAVLRSDEEQQAVEVPLEDGRTFYASIAPILDPQGLIAGKVVVMRDVTHFKELDEMKSDFVATVSHDLRAPLTFIRGYATMLMMVGDLNDKQHDYLERILAGIDQMSALIGDLLNLRRIEAGVGVRQEPCRLGLVLVEAVDTMRARATNKGVMLRLEPAEGAPTVIGDCTLIRQAVSNLVDNAIKYTPAGGQVKVGLDVNDSEVVIYIADTGIGIAPEDLVRLFEKFYRIKRRETSDIQGTGLGLALVKSIVERHGGRVWVDSDVNKGSTFYIALQLPNEEGGEEGEGAASKKEK